MSENEEPNAKDVALTAIREAIGTQEQARAKAVENLKGIDTELKVLRAAEKALDPSTPAAAPRETSVDAAKRVMQEKGTATMAEVAVAIGKPKNTAKLALARLEEQGVIEKTGEQVNRSPQFKLVAAA